MSRIPAPVARRIERLARHAHAFHRLAHHPLCDAYSGEVLRWGHRTRICKGCAFLALGASGGLVAGWALPFSIDAIAAASVAAAIFGAVVWIRNRGQRKSKVLTRLIPGFLLAWLSLAGVISGTGLGLLAGGVAAMAFGATWIRYRRRGPNRQACADCPQRLAFPKCKGYQPMLARERAFRRRAGQLLAQI